MSELLKCPWCGFKGPYRTLPGHFSTQHFLPYPVAVEVATMTPSGEDGECYKCHSPKTPLTFLLEDRYYVPCWSCVSMREKKTMIRSVLEEIKEFYDKVLSDRYLQLFLIDPIYFEATLPHTYDVFKMILGKKNLPSRNAIWFVDWEIGYPRMISIENLEGILIKDLGELYNIESEKDFVRVNSYTIEAPKIVKYDQLHHSRYNIFNPGGIRSSKRLRIPKTDTCYKFYNNPGTDEWKSILKITDKEGKEIVPSQVPPLDLLTLKLVLLRNKSIMRTIFQILQVILEQGVGYFRDQVFLRNTLSIDPVSRPRTLNLRWTVGDEAPVPDQINISIL